MLPTTPSGHSGSPAGPGTSGPGGKPSRPNASRAQVRTAVKSRTRLVTAWATACSSSGRSSPSGGSPEKPVGLVHFAAARKGQPTIHLEQRFGDLGRTAIRLSSVRTALDLAKAAVDAAFRQDYTSGVFVNEATVGKLRGTVSLEHIGARAASATRLPDIVVTFVSLSLQCDRPTLCAASIADTLLDEGEVLRGSFSRADTWNFIAARGPDFQKGLNSKVPASNADVIRTMGELLQLSTSIPAEAPGRVLVESLRGNEGMRPRVSREVISSKATKDGWITEVHLQRVGSTKYFYAAGGPGWTVGIAPRPAPIEWRPWKWDWPRIKRIRISIDSEDPEFEPFPPIFRDHSSP